MKFDEVAKSWEEREREEREERGGEREVDEGKVGRESLRSSLADVYHLDETRGSGR